MNDVEELNKEMDKELENSPALKMAFVQIRSIDKRTKEIEEQMKRGFCPNCGKGMELHKQDMETPISKDYVECPQCNRVIKRK